jgi:hypothetical protein
LKQQEPQAVVLGKPDLTPRLPRFAALLPQDVIQFGPMLQTMAAQVGQAGGR